MIKHEEEEEEPFDLIKTISAKLTTMSSMNEKGGQKSKLLAAVKKEVKHVMEESVTRKYVQEDSGSVTALCAAVEACLSQGLRRRALGLFKTSSTTALLHKIAKHNEEAALISRKVRSMETSTLDNATTTNNRRSSSSSESLTTTTTTTNSNKSNAGHSIKKTSSLPSGGSSTTVLTTTNTATLPKYLWIRLALFEKQLARIIDHLVTNAHRYYERDALVADADYGNILSSLLVGPCALDYTKNKPMDRYWSDPPADELVQRKMIYSGTVQSTPPPVRRPINYKRILNTSAEESRDRRHCYYRRSAGSGGANSGGSTQNVKDYVESLHQNHRDTLLFGKNNVRVLPAGTQEPMPGYLSLHQSAHHLTVKWTPNQLINGYSEEVADKSVYWDYALHVRLDEIVYVHVHQDSVILVGQDGVQRPHIHFPKGGHTLAFLSCIETGLLPRGRLDPPLWSSHHQRGVGGGIGLGLGNRKKTRRPLPALDNDASSSTTNDNSGGNRDYVFRIIDNLNSNTIPKRVDLMDTHAKLSSSSSKVPQRVHLVSSSTSSSDSSGGKSIDSGTVSGGSTLVQPLTPPPPPYPPPSSPNVCNIRAVCDSMKRQIISRAFYGWLAYCRHLSTVRTHLSGLVNSEIVHGDSEDERRGIDEESWRRLQDEEGVVRDGAEVFRAVYFGGIANDSLRQQIWPYLLGHFKFGSTVRERDVLNEETKQAYENTMSEWLAVEAIVKQRDKESTANAIAKLSAANSSNQDNKNENRDNNDLDLDDGAHNEKRSRRHRRRPKTKAHNNDDDIEEEEEDVDDDDDNDDVDEEEEVFEDEDGAGSDYEYISNNEDLSSDGGAGGGDGCGGGRNGAKNLLNKKTPEEEQEENGVEDEEEFERVVNNDFVHEVIVVTNASVDMSAVRDQHEDVVYGGAGGDLDAVAEECNLDSCLEAHGLVSPACVSPASSNGGVYTTELLETFGLNLHRIEKDVQRCDRNFWYFGGGGAGSGSGGGVGDTSNEKNIGDANLDKLRNIMCTYVWEHLDIGYMQGMCDLVAPLLVVFNDESLTYACFCHLMDGRMVENFPNGTAMDAHFANMRSLIQILDAEMYELMHAHGDYTHFYFCYRWFLLDFKRELVYEDVYRAWETIWAANRVSSVHFVLFLALAFLESYRDIILSNCMDFTDIIKFFNEMAEHHDATAMLKMARDLVLQLQLLIENK